MKNNWKKVSTVLMILAATASIHAASPDSGIYPGEKEVKENTTAIQVKGEKVFVNHLNLDGETVTLKVYDEENRLLYRESFKETPVVEKAFNFEDAYEGTYSVVLSDGESSFKATVEITF